MPSIARLTPERFMTALRNHCTSHRNTGLRAFFSMEVYGRDGRPGGGGLGTLSKDWLRECSDQGLPIVGVTIAHRTLHQQKFSDLWQNDKSVSAKLQDNPELTKLGQQVRLNIQGREMPVDIWGELIEGRNGSVVPLVLLSTANCGIDGFDRITDRVYPGKHDWFSTLGQEIVLGIGGVKALQELNVPVELYHLNDGHPALAAAQILHNMGVTPEGLNEAALNRMREKVVYSSHTLVGAAADMFFPDNVNNMIQDPTIRRLAGLLGSQPVDGKLKAFDAPMVLNGALDMAGLAMFSAGKIYAVSRLNGELLKNNFPQHADRIGGGITNAVHPSWASGPIATLFDSAAPGWVAKPEELARIESLRSDRDFRAQFWGAHMAAKTELINLIQHSKEDVAKAGLDPDIFSRDLDPEILTVGFARRVAAYKRHDLLAHDLDALVASVAHDRPIQFIFAGKAHAMDGDPGGGKSLLQKLLRAGQELNKKYPDRIKFLFLPNYDVKMARVLIPGVDIWLNNPIWGLEASGTSTMDAILNGVLLVTTDDGCVPEMREKGDVGWIFGQRKPPLSNGNYTGDSYALYASLSAASETYYHGIKNSRLTTGKQTIWMEKMINTVAHVVPYFLTPRMVAEYKKLMWGLE